MGELLRYDHKRCLRASHPNGRVSNLGKSFMLFSSLALLRVMPERRNYIANSKDPHMSGLLILIVAALWAVIGFALWKRLVRPHIHSSGRLFIATLVLAAIWFVGPVLDEILGARSFARACAEMPEVKFHGPLSIGAGAFFDDQGTPRWTNAEEFAAIKRKGSIWNDLFGDRQEWIELSKWPIPIYQSHSTYFAKSTGTPMVESYYRTSPGGWIRRALQWSIQAPYQCIGSGRFPADEERIVFRTN